MIVFDHLFFVGLAVVYPVLSWLSYRKLCRRMAAGEIIDPVEIYRSTLAALWSLFGVAIVLWLLTGRSWHDLGLGLEVDAGFGIGLVLTIAAIAAVVRQFGGMDAADDKTRKAWRRQLGELRVIVPRNDRQLRLFYGMSATAGIVEETLWRGYLIWYLGHAMPVWTAAIVSSVIFGIGHSYQGIASVPKIALVGAAFAALYLLTGSVWLPMLLHAVFDAVQGRAARKILGDGEVESDSAAGSDTGDP